MGKLLILVFVFAFSLSAWAIEKPTITHQKTNEGSLVQIDINGLEQGNVAIEDEDFSSLTIPGEGFTTEAGAPQIPVVHFEIEVASEQVEVSLVNSDKAKAESFVMPTKVVPFQESTAKIAGVQSVFKMNSKAYSSTELYPAEQVRVASVGSVRGHLIATIEVAPIRYIAATSKVFFTQQMQVLVKSVGPSQAKAEKALSTSFDALNANVLNYESQASAPKEKLLIIAAKSFPRHAPWRFWEHDGVSDLVAAKSKAGFDVSFVTTAKTGETADSIRTYIHDFYKKSLRRNPLVYVLLVGDTDTIPSFDAGEQFTDNYYASIDTDSYKGDEIYRDLAVGRLAVKTEAELVSVVKKIEKYAKRSANNGWTKRAAWLGTDDRYKVAEGTHNYVIDTYTKEKSYTGNFPSMNEPGGDKLYAITYKAKTPDIQKALDDGRSFVVYSGHGSETYWAGPHVSQTEIAAIANKDALPYVMSFACVSGSFAGWKEYNYEAGVQELVTKDSFGEMWLKKENGAIGFFGTTNSSYWDEDDILERVFFDGFYKEHTRTAGLTNNFGLDGVRKFYAGAGRTKYYYEIYNLIGDPTIALKQ